ncbi:hypothetical protein GCM10010399_79110 [Dactylosporangium fulvum]|uniref:DUF4407 domain-containing protein n=1 Tax=Dactylosporangium fulvum TaxID=53359 RepID=A0ABY5VZS6_9ACTN|nr:DUF4407 domain-containing protein [Dactylosporangium fulvum]UWP83222.1 DUF4407 domain-containing protein [Dactylosporangium fulvum]
MRPGLVLAWVGGAHPPLLRESPNDAMRYSSMGAVLVGTAGMAALSATFALTTAVRLPVGPAAVVGVLWGLLILSLDRMLVISMSRQNGFWRGLGAALPRLGLALLIGTVISVPLVLRIFEPEINAELKVMHAEQGVENQKKLDAQFADIAGKQRRVDELQRIAGGAVVPEVSSDPDVKAAQKEVDDAQKAYDTAAGNAQCELNGTCGTGSKGDGPAYQAAKAVADQAQERLNQANAKLKQVTDATTTRLGNSAASQQKAAQDELATAAPDLERRKADQIAAQRALDNAENESEGLLARLEALEQLSNGHPTMWTAHLALMALFACIELLPVLAKLLSKNTSSKYDDLVEQREQHALDADLRRLADQDKIDALAADARLQLETDRLEHQVARGKRANQLLAETQEELARKAIDTWAQIAEQRTDEELDRWYRQHSRGTARTVHVPAQPAVQPAVQQATQPTAQMPVNGHHLHNPAAPTAGS